MSFRSVAAGLCHFFLDKKVTKKSSQPECFFALDAFALQIRQNLGCKILPHYRSLKAWLRKFRYALQPHWPALFCLISSEAARLTGKDSYHFYKMNLF
jgi:hypothetical protein